MRTSGIRVRILCLLLCLAVLVPSVSALGETTKVATYLLRLREGPSYSAKVLDAYPRGTRVTILKKGDQWTKVQVHGKTGYMQSDLLSYAKYKGGSKKTTTTAAKTDTGKTTNNTMAAAVSGDTARVMDGIRLNLRDAPNSAGEVIACFRGGTVVNIIRKGRYWSYVGVKEYEGYMANEYLVFGE